MYPVDDLVEPVRTDDALTHVVVLDLLEGVRRQVLHAFVKYPTPNYRMGYLPSLDYRIFLSRAVSP
jgi:hypothetical protein